MTIKTSQILSMTEANQNFSKVTRVVEKNGSAAVIFKNNKPKFVVIDIATNPMLDLTDDEKIEIAAKRVLEKYKPAFMELAK